MLSGLMSNPFGDYDEDTTTRQQEVIVKEGFLCPVCVRDCRTITELREHFETAHQNDERSSDGSGASSQSKLLSSQLKGLFNKTKKILTIDNSNVSYDESNDSIASNFSNTGVNFMAQWKQQMVIGPTRTHFDYFRQIRDSRVERYVVETNKLLIRLDKLISDAPTDPEKRKVHEKRVVFWANDADVKLCPNCAKSFNLSRRRHHCRLCGGIMCHNCSQFLDFAYARKLVSPSGLEASSLSLLPKPPTLTRRGSNSSLLSMMNSSGDPHIRVCKECKLLLDKRDQQIEDNLANPIIYQMYDRMRQHVIEIQKLTPLYNQMCDSLSIGETNYSLRDAQELRIKITKLGESVDIISTKISKLGTEDDAMISHTKQYKLQTAIRSAMVTFLRETMLGLPTLPTPEELTKLQEQRRLEIEKRILYEKQMALEEQSRSSSSSPQIKTQQTRKLVANNSTNNSEDDFLIVSPDYGWAPEVSHKRNPSADHSQDPMLQQIKIIQNYIKQAREAHKYDEVYMLEENLKELEIEYLMQEHGADQEQSANTNPF